MIVKMASNTMAGTYTLEISQGDVVKVFRDDEALVNLAGLEEFVQDCSVLVLIADYLALLLASEESDTIRAVRLEIYPCLSAAKRNGSHSRSHDLG